MNSIHRFLHFLDIGDKLIYQGNENTVDFSNGREYQFYGYVGDKMIISTSLGAPLLHPIYDDYWTLSNKKDYRKKNINFIKSLIQAYESYSFTLIFKAWNGDEYSFKLKTLNYLGAKGHFVGIQYNKEEYTYDQISELIYSALEKDKVDFETYHFKVKYDDIDDGKTVKVNNVVETICEEIHKSSIKDRLIKMQGFKFNEKSIFHGKDVYESMGKQDYFIRTCLSITDFQLTDNISELFNDIVYVMENSMPSAAATYYAKVLTGQTVKKLPDTLKSVYGKYPEFKKSLYYTINAFSRILYLEKVYYDVKEINDARFPLTTARIDNQKLEILFEKLGLCLKK